MIWSLILQMGSGMGWWSFGFLGPLFGFLIMAVIVFTLWSAFRTGWFTDSSPEQSDDAMETLRRRYARGDIDEETFESRAQTLREQ